MQRNQGFLSEEISRISEEDKAFNHLAYEVAEEISLLMQSSAITKADLAKRLKTSRPYVTQVLMGDANLSLRTIAKLSVAFGVKVHLRFDAPLDTFQWSGATVRTSKVAPAFSGNFTEIPGAHYAAVVNG